MNRPRRYADWIDAHRWWVLLAAIGVAAAGALLSMRLALKPDMSNLLPPGQKSVRHLEELKRRAPAFGTEFAVVEAPGDPELRARATKALQARLEQLPPELVASVVYDDGPARRYFWEHRFLFAPLDDLREARDALKDKIKQEKLKANPLYINLEDDGDAAAGGKPLEDRIAELRKRLDEAEARAEAADGFVSTDGSMQLLIVRTAFGSSDFSKGAVLVREMHRIFAELRREMPGVDFGATGNVIKSLEEKDAVVRGMATAAVITILLCAIALFLYYRSVLPVLASLWSLAVGTLATFGFAKLAIGHLNMVTAFLAAIVVGNGINSGLILLARYFEEIRRGNEGNDALGRAIGGALHGTLAAALAAGVAYGSLVVTDFRGFRHFGLIGFVGMVLCWLAAFTILPAGLAVLWRGGRIRTTTAPAIGRVLSRLLPTNLGAVAIVGLVLTLVSAGVTAHYVLSDPLQEDWGNLRPTGSTTEKTLVWSDKVDEGFKTKFQRGLTQRFVIGLERRDQVAPVVAMLRAVDDGKPPEQELMSNVASINDLVPEHQADKLAVLDEIRALLDDDLVQQFSDDDKQLIERIRPPDDIAPLTDASVPAELLWPFTERDGTVGRLILATGSLRFKTWNVRHRMEFAKGFRALKLPAGAIVGGQSFIFADMVKAMGEDGPVATVVALLGAILTVGLIVGFGRHGAITLACAVAGIFGMIALVSAFGLEVNVIDFIALPITIGLGVDYAVNIVARERQEAGARGPHAVVATTGGAVLLCSFTTMVGYGSLLLSDSGGIRSFGLAAILGEIACVLAALAFAPALLAMLRRRETPKRQ